MSEGKKLKVLHCSDIHLDSPYVGLTGDKSDERRRELRSTFMRLGEYIREREIDYVLIAGDLFDTAYATNTTVEILIREFKNCKNTKFIIAPGRHDAYLDNPVYQSGRLPENCFVFSSDKLDRFDFEEDRVTVYGWAFMKEELDESPLFDNHVDDSSKINLVVGYADLGDKTGTKCCPISPLELNRFGADYYAFGSRHEKTEFFKRSGTMYSYSGALECTGFDQPYIGGVKLLTIDYNDGEMCMDGKQLSFGHIRFVVEQIDITGVNANNEITNRISQLISEKKYGVETALRVELVGSVDPHFTIPKKMECDAFGLYFFDMVDKTLPTYNTLHYERDMSVAGEIYRRLLPALKSENEEERLIAARAFRAGLAALEQREIE